jgi:hypothetical protein
MNHGWKSREKGKGRVRRKEKTEEERRKFKVYEKKKTVYRTGGCLFVSRKV